MSADSTVDCPACGMEENFREYYEFYFTDGKLHADFGGECPERWGGCGYTFEYKFEPYPLPGLPIKPPDTGFTGLI